MNALNAIEGISEPDASKLVIKAMRDFLISYAKAINRNYHRSGALFGNLEEFIRIHKERVIDEASFKGFLFDE